MCDPEEMVRCPYDKHHLILKSRLTTHLCKCRRQYGGNEYTSCPFNSTHKVLKPELQFHIDMCPDREALDPCEDVEADEKLRESINIDVPPPSENWDDEPPQTKSYLDVKDELLRKAPILRAPVGRSKAEKKKFLKEQMRLFEQEAAGHAAMPGPSGSRGGGSRPSKTLMPQPMGSEGKPKSWRDTGSDDDDDDDDLHDTIVLKGRGRGRQFR